MILPDRSYYGLDGCKSGWFYVCMTSGRTQYGVVSTVQEIFNRDEDKRVLIDIPIGLATPQKPVRACDQQARQLLGKRRSSVFSMPIRDLLAVEDYAVLNAQSKAITGKGISKQSYAILPKVREVDHCLKADISLRGVVREAHPELCFTGLKGAPMHFNKATEEGFEERIAVLESYRAMAAAEINTMVAAWKSSKVAVNDIVDAYVCALTASMEEHWVTIPRDLDADDSGLAMSMTYCATGELLVPQ